MKIIATTFFVFFLAITWPIWLAGFIWCGVENVFWNGYRIFDAFVDWL